MYSIFEEADKIIDGVKREEYGDMYESFARVANAWSAVLNRPFSVQEVALMMIIFKTCRETNAHKPDNLVDICGYTKCLGKLNGIDE